MIPRWSVECGKRLDRWDPETDDDTLIDFTFTDFLSFLKRQNQIAVFRSSITGADRGREKSVKIAAAAWEEASISGHEIDDTPSADIANAKASLPQTSKHSVNASGQKTARASSSAPATPKDSSTAAAAVRTGNAAGWSCLCCDKTIYHSLDRYDMFLKKGDREKFALLRLHRLCILCQKKGTWPAIVRNHGVVVNVQATTIAWDKWTEQSA